MGSGSERMIEAMEQQRDAAIATHLGLDADEYEEAGAFIDIDVGNDGMEYGTYIVFPQGTAPSLLRKVKGLEGDRVLLPPGFLDSEDTDQD